MVYGVEGVEDLIFFRTFGGYHRLNIAIAALKARLDRGQGGEVERFEPEVRDSGLRRQHALLQFGTPDSDDSRSFRAPDSGDVDDTPAASAGRPNGGEGLRLQQDQEFLETIRVGGVAKELFFFIVSSFCERAYSLLLRQRCSCRKGTCSTELPTRCFPQVIVAAKHTPNPQIPVKKTTIFVRKCG